FYRGGELIDEYNSRPGYFSQSDRATEEAASGEPARFADLLKQPVLKVKQLLVRDTSPAGLWAMEQFQQFARALGLANAATAYEYFEENGEWDGIRQRSKFVHIPSRPSQKEVELTQKQALREQVAHLKQAGRLIASYEAPKDSMIEFRPDALCGGF